MSVQLNSTHTHLLRAYSVHVLLIAASNVQHQCQPSFIGSGTDAAAAFVSRPVWLMTTSL